MWRYSLVLMLALTATEAPIRLEVWPRVTLYRDNAQVRYRVWIPRHADNRAWSIQWDSETGLSGASAETMDGQHAAQVYEDYVYVSPGTYVFQACVARRYARHCAATTINVIGG